MASKHWCDICGAETECPIALKTKSNWITTEGFWAVCRKCNKEINKAIHNTINIIQKEGDQ